MAKTDKLSVDDLVDQALELRDEDLGDAERQLLAERLTEGGRYWAKLAISLVRESKRCRGARSRSAKLELLKMARACFKSSLDADKPAELAEVKRLADLLEQQQRAADKLDRLD